MNLQLACRNNRLCLRQFEIRHQYVKPCASIHVELGNMLYVHM